MTSDIIAWHGYAGFYHPHKAMTVAHPIMRLGQAF